jgi:hypothetical protein
MKCQCKSCKGEISFNEERYNWLTYSSFTMKKTASGGNDQCEYLEVTLGADEWEMIFSDPDCDRAIKQREAGTRNKAYLAQQKIDEAERKSQIAEQWRDRLWG